MGTTEMQASEVRKNFAETLNESEYRKPQIFRRRSTEFAIMTMDDLYDLLGMAVIPVTVQQSEGAFIVTSELMEDIIAIGNTMQDALAAFEKELRDYAHEYYENFALYSNAPNRKHHAPYIFRILAATNDLTDMFEIAHA